MIRTLMLKVSLGEYLVEILDPKDPDLKHGPHPKLPGYALVAVHVGSQTRFELHHPKGGNFGHIDLVCYLEGSGYVFRNYSSIEVFLEEVDELLQLWPTGVDDLIFVIHAVENWLKTIVNYNRNILSWAISSRNTRKQRTA